MTEIISWKTYLVASRATGGRSRSGTTTAAGVRNPNLNLGRDRLWHAMADLDLNFLFNLVRNHHGVVDRLVFGDRRAMCNIVRAATLFWGTNRDVHGVNDLFVDHFANLGSAGPGFRGTNSHLHVANDLLVDHFANLGSAGAGFRSAHGVLHVANDLLVDHAANLNSTGPLFRGADGILHVVNDLFVDHAANLNSAGPLFRSANRHGVLVRLINTDLFVDRAGDNFLSWVRNPHFASAGRGAATASVSTAGIATSTTSSATIAGWNLLALFFEVTTINTDRVRDLLRNGLADLANAGLGFLVRNHDGVGLDRIAVNWLADGRGHLLGFRVGNHDGVLADNVPIDGLADGPRDLLGFLVRNHDRVFFGLGFRNRNLLRHGDRPLTSFCGALGRHHLAGFGRHLLHHHGRGAGLALVVTTTTNSSRYATSGRSTTTASGFAASRRSTTTAAARSTRIAGFTALAAMRRLSRRDEARHGERHQAYTKNTLHRELLQNKDGTYVRTPQQLIAGKKRSETNRFVLV